MFACQSLSSVVVYKFYTWDKPKDWDFRKHSGFIRSISWLEDDSGFASCGYDEIVCLWKLNPECSEEEKKNNPNWQLMYESPYSDANKTDYTHVSVSKTDNDKHPIIYACGADNIIREIEPFEKDNAPT
jgi:WD40 repeat protein